MFLILFAAIALPVRPVAGHFSNLAAAVTKVSSPGAPAKTAELAAALGSRGIVEGSSSAAIPWLGDDRGLGVAIDMSDPHLAGKGLAMTSGQRDASGHLLPPDNLLTPSADAARLEKKDVFYGLSSDLIHTSSSSSAMFDLAVSGAFASAKASLTQLNKSEFASDSRAMTIYCYREVEPQRIDPSQYKSAVIDYETKRHLYKRNRHKFVEQWGTHVVVGYRRYLSYRMDVSFGSASANQLAFQELAASASYGVAQANVSLSTLTSMISSSANASITGKEDGAFDGRIRLPAKEDIAPGSPYLDELDAFIDKQRAGAAISHSIAILEPWDKVLGMDTPPVSTYPLDKDLLSEYLRARRIVESDQYAIDHFDDFKTLLLVDKLELLSHHAAASKRADEAQRLLEDRNLTSDQKTIFIEKGIDIQSLRLPRIQAQGKIIGPGWGAYVRIILPIWMKDKTFKIVTYDAGKNSLLEHTIVAGQDTGPSDFHFGINFPDWQKITDNNDLKLVVKVGSGTDSVSTNWNPWTVEIQGDEGEVIAKTQAMFTGDATYNSPNFQELLSGW